LRFLNAFINPRNNVADPRLVNIPGSSQIGLLVMLP
jgi:hypothetical protein